MATTIIAGNATNGLTLTPDNTGALELKTGTGSGTTALTLDSSQNATVAGTLKAAGVTTALYPLVSGTSISTATTSFTGATSGASTTLTASSVTGTIQVGQVVTGTNIVAGTSIIAQVSGTTGGSGTYTLSQASSGTVSGTITVVGVDFYNIPSWAKRVTVMLSGVSTNGTSVIQIQLGSGSVTTSGYTSSCGAVNAGTGQAGSTTGFAITTGTAAASSQSGAITLSLFNANTWVSSGNLQYTNAVGAMYFSAGVSPALSGSLDRVRITTVNGTDTFDAGSVNILYE